MRFKISCLAVVLALVMSACAGGEASKITTDSTPPSDTSPTLVAPQPTPCVDGPFVIVTDMDSTIRADIRYAGSNNFVGTALDGYLQPIAILTRQAAEALVKVNKQLREQGLGLLIYDAYRPQRAVDHILRWSHQSADTLTRQQFYPHLSKYQIRCQGYISRRSKHAMGSTVDLTIISLATGQPIDMGSGFDMLDPVSNFHAAGLTSQQSQNRQLLRNVMCRNGFYPIEAEWWHFTLCHQPYTRAFDIPVHRDSVALFLR